MAADLAKLSLWLVTLSRDHEFTFLDHAIRTGDALVGLSLRNIESLNWVDTTRVSFITAAMHEDLERAFQSREHIRNADEATDEHALRLILQEADQYLADLRLIGDALGRVFLATRSPQERERLRKALEFEMNFADGRWPDRVHAFLSSLPGSVDHGIFHWELEFPEIFRRSSPGFDAIVGNPPYMGGAKISTNLACRTSIGCVSFTLEPAISAIFPLTS